MISKENFVKTMKQKFTEVKNPPLPEEYRDMWGILLHKHHDEWIRRKFSKEVKAHAESLYDLHNSPLYKALK
jgi:hypothetical protein